jgi:hypothetical protein
MLMLFVDSLLLRVSREGSGFAYIDVETGITGVTTPQADVEIPRWSIQQANTAGQLETLFEFSGPAPIVSADRKAAG